MKRQTRRFPFQTAPREYLSLDGLEIRHDLLVVDLEHGDRQYPSPVIDDPTVLVKSMSDVIGRTRPANASEVGYIAGDGHIAKIALAVNHLRAGEEHGDKAKVAVIVGQLIGNMIRSSVQSLEPSKMALGDQARLGAI